MIITCYSIGAGKKRSKVYAICTTPAENGSSRPEEITRFDTMEAAALVLRYLTGAALEAEDAARAREILRTADTQGATLFSKENTQKKKTVQTKENKQ